MGCLVSLAGRLINPRSFHKTKRREQPSPIGIEHGKSYIYSNCHCNMEKAEYYYKIVWRCRTHTSATCRGGMSSTPRAWSMKGPQIDDEGRRWFGLDCGAGAGESARVGEHLPRRGCGDAAEDGLPAPNPPRQCRLCLPPRRAHQGLPRAAWVRPGVVLSTSLVHVLISATDAYAALAYCADPGGTSPSPGSSASSATAGHEGTRGGGWARRMHQGGGHGAAVEARQEALRRVRPHRRRAAGGRREEEALCRCSGQGPAQEEGFGCCGGSCSGRWGAGEEVAEEEGGGTGGCDSGEDLTEEEGCGGAGGKEDLAEVEALMDRCSFPFAIPVLGSSDRWL